MVSRGKSSQDNFSPILRVKKSAGCGSNLSGHLWSHIVDLNPITDFFNYQEYRILNLVFSLQIPDSKFEILTELGQKSKIHLFSNKNFSKVLSLFTNGK